MQVKLVSYGHSNMGTMYSDYLSKDPIGLSNFGIISEMIGPEELTQD